MRVFVSDLDSYVGKTLRRVLKAADEELDLVGTVANPEAAADIRGASTVIPMGSGGVADLARSADAIVFDITTLTPDTNIIIDAFRTGSFEDAEKVVVALSSALTWMATSKPRDGGGFQESAFKRRKPTPLFASVKTLESHVMSLSRDGLRSHVVGAGILYGNGENYLHMLFKEAWICESPAVHVPCLGGDGSNVLPMIHVADACSIVSSVISSDPSSQYILAVDNAKSTLRDIATAISASLGPGPVELMPAADAEALLVTNDAVPALQADLQFEAEEAAAGGMGFEWVAQDGFVEAIDGIVAEFVKHRNLRPVRAVLVGPPGSGKSLLADRLGARYYTPVVRTGDAVAIALGQAPPEVSAAIGPIKAWPEGLQEAVTTTMKEKGRLSVKVVSRVIHTVLTAPRLRNRGYVLDGFPRTCNEAKSLLAVAEDMEFEAEEEPPAEGEEEPDDGDVECDPAVLPTGVVFLDAEDEVLEKRILALPESAVAGTHNTEEGFKRRLAAYRAANAPHGVRTVATFIEEKAGLEVLDLKLGVDADVDETVDRIIAPYVEQGGAPYNYHPTDEEIAAQEAAAKAKEDAVAAAARRAAEAETAEAEAARKRLDEETAARTAEVAKQEASLLEARSAPLRQYLVANVIPTLTQGLLQVSKVKPSDPVDFLAEYLFKQSPPEGE